MTGERRAQQEDGDAGAEQLGETAILLLLAATLA